MYSNRFNGALPALVTAVFVSGLLGAGLFGAPAMAQDPIFYVSGEISFDFMQWPFGGYSGNFSAAGEMVGLDGELPPDQDEAVGGGMGTALDDTTGTVAYGIVRNGDESLDIVFLWLTTIGPPLPDENYHVEPDELPVGFLYFDQVENFTLPGTTDPDSLMAWFEDLDADYKFFATSGSIDIEEASADALIGSFDGMMGDPDSLMLITVTDGDFSLVGGVLTVDPAELPTPLASTRAYPNPFNPQTNIELVLTEPLPVTVTVFDPAGHRVRLLHSGQLSAGSHTCLWDGRDESGVRLAGGVYLYKVFTPVTVRTGKVVLAP